MSATTFMNNVEHMNFEGADSFPDALASAPSRAQRVFVAGLRIKKVRHFDQACQLMDCDRGPPILLEVLR